MNFSPEQLDELHKYGKALTPISDVAVLMRLDVDELRDEIASPMSDAHFAFESGRAQTELEIRTTEINMASNGSPIAIQRVKDYVNNILIDK